MRRRWWTTAKVDETGKQDLEAYLAQLARPWPAGRNPDERKLTVHWVLQNFPITSIWPTDHSFAAGRQTLNGKKFSLNQIEGRLRDASDPRIRAALVCASRSCPRCGGKRTSRTVLISSWTTMLASGSRMRG